MEVRLSSARAPRVSAPRAAPARALPGARPAPGRRAPPVPGRRPRVCAAPAPPADAPAAAVAPPAAPPAARRPRRRPEVLAPAGGWPQLRAAVENGADAVYFGAAAGFNARARAENFAVSELPEVMAYLHERGVLGYLALNVLAFDAELPALAELGAAAQRAGVDAAIVQDLGGAALLRAAAPGLPLHGSTQMSVTSPEGAAFAAGLGVTRVVVGRELSVSEIAAVVAKGGGVEVETFVHGALCISYSGQCFSSETWGGRSANRGQCAQACRLPYGLLVDGELRAVGDAAYLLSPQVSSENVLETNQPTNRPTNHSLIKTLKT
jgi:collagenase-like PrtC family protease